MTWNGKNLTGGTNIIDISNYSYDENGLRLQKTGTNYYSDKGLI